MFSLTGNKGFQITFENGNTVSIQWGPGNYCKLAEQRASESGEFAHTVEAAAWDRNNNWHNCGGDQVKGWLTPDEALEFITFVANNELDITSPFTDWTDEQYRLNPEAHKDAQRPTESVHRELRIIDDTKGSIRRKDDGASYF